MEPRRRLAAVLALVGTFAAVAARGADAIDSARARRSRRSWRKVLPHAGAAEDRLESCSIASSRTGASRSRRGSRRSRPTSSSICRIASSSTSRRRSRRPFSRVCGSSARTSNPSIASTARSERGSRSPRSSRWPPTPRSFLSARPGGALRDSGAPDARSRRTAPGRERVRGACDTRPGAARRRAPPRHAPGGRVERLRRRRDAPREARAHHLRGRGRRAQDRRPLERCRSSLARRRLSGDLRPTSRCCPGQAARTTRARRCSRSSTTSRRRAALLRDGEPRRSPIRAEHPRPADRGLRHHHRRRLLLRRVAVPERAGGERRLHHERRRRHAGGERRRPRPGALYFSSAGNAGNLDDGTSGTWEGRLRRRRARRAPLAPGTVHDFAGAGAHVRHASRRARQPDQPLLVGSARRLGERLRPLRLQHRPDTVLAASTNIQNGTQDPVRAGRHAATRHRITASSSS